MKKSETPKPEPVPTNTVCSLCGEVWAWHSPDANGNVTTLECIRLLKLKVATPSYVPYPVCIPAVYPYVPAPYPVYPPIWHNDSPFRVTFADNSYSASPLVLNCTASNN